jgi:hypothetical protein
VGDVFDRNQRCYPLIQSAFDTVIAPTNSDCCLITDLKTEAKVAEIARPDKTGSLDQIMAQAGRRIASFTASMSAAGNGTAGTPPDCKNFLQGMFGGAGAVVAATSVTWSLADVLVYLAIWNYSTGSGNATSMVAFNSLVQKMEATFGGDTPMFTFSGESGWVGDNDQFADGTNTPAAAKGGLVAWPSEPTTPVVSGVPPQGFKVTATIDGNAYTNILSGKVALDVMRELLKNGNSEFPGAGAPGDRKVAIDWSMADNDSANLRSLKQKAFSRTPVNAVFTVGSLAGNRWVHTCNNIIVPKPTYGTSGTRRTVNFAGAIAYPSAITLRDQYTLAVN